MKIIETREFKLVPKLARAVRYGETFQIYNPGTEDGIGPFFIRVKPVNFLLNSSLLGDIINRGDIITVNLEKNTLYYMQGDTRIKVKSSQIVIGDQEE